MKKSAQYSARQIQKLEDLGESVWAGKMDTKSTKEIAKLVQTILAGEKKEDEIANQSKAVQSKCKHNAAEDEDNDNDSEDGARLQPPKHKCRRRQAKDTPKGNKKSQGMYGLCEFINL